MVGDRREIMEKDESKNVFRSLAEETPSDILINTAVVIRPGTYYANSRVYRETAGSPSLI